MRVECNGQVVPKREWTPFIRRVVKRHERIHRRRLRASGILIGAANVHSFAAVLRIYTSSSGTDSIPDGALNAIAEVWGGGGSAGTIGGGHFGGGGGGGGRAISAFSVAASPFKTIAYSVGAGGSSGLAGSNSTISSGSFSITTMTGSGGGAGSNGSVGGPGADGSGGTASGGTTSNTTGNSGNNGVGGVGLGGTVSGDGAPYGGGGSSSGNPGLHGAAVFSYTG
jgi:MSHA biogenesis protein MshQ